VAILGKPSAAWVVSAHALGWAGASVVPLDPAAPITELRERVRIAGCVAVILIDAPQLAEERWSTTVLHLTRSDVERSTGSTGSPGSTDSTGSTDPAQPTVGPPEPTWALDDERALLFTSGSSGTPKPIALTTAQLLFATLGQAIHLGHDLADAWHACLPPWHIGGLAILLRTAWCQTTLDLGLGFYPASINAAIDRGSITQLSLVPAMLRRLIAARARRRFPPSLRWILLGGAAADEADILAAEALGATVCTTWGMTESAAQLATRSPAMPRIQGVVGSPLPFARVERDPTSGCLVARGPQVGDVEALATRDLGEIGPFGQVRILGRSDRLVISGGRNIDPVAVEQVLMRHPYVAQALVLSVPDRQLGEALVAVIAPLADTSIAQENEADLATFAAAHLHRYDRPRHWALVRTLPTTAAGKISAAVRSSIQARLLARLGLNLGSDLDLDLNAEPLETFDKASGRSPGPEIREVDKAVLVLDPGVHDIISPRTGAAAHLKRDPDPSPATSASRPEHDPAQDDRQTITEPNRTPIVRPRADHRQTPAGALHRRKPRTERAAEDILPGVVAPLEIAAKEGDTGGVDLSKADHVDMGGEHRDDELRPSPQPEQAHGEPSRNDPQTDDDRRHPDE